MLMAFFFVVSVVIGIAVHARAYGPAAFLFSWLLVLLLT